jgi:hypothetical protein
MPVILAMSRLARDMSGSPLDQVHKILGELHVLPDDSDLLHDSEIETALKNGTLSLKARLTVSEKGKVVFRLCPPTLGHSDRFARQFGSDRFLRCSLDRATELAIQKESSPAAENLRQFLAKPIDILGRRFRAVYHKDGTLFFFAETGYDIEPISLLEFAKAHIDFERNASMSLAK